MYRSGYIHTRTWIARFMLALFVLIMGIKTLHTHTYSDHGCQHEKLLTKAGAHHSPCSICEFQLAGDASFTGTITFALAPVHVSPTYTRLITAINPDGTGSTDSRGPPSLS